MIAMCLIYYLYQRPMLCKLFDNSLADPVSTAGNHCNFSHKFRHPRLPRIQFLNPLAMTTLIGSTSIFSQTFSLT